jgi:hypothetical protein
VIGISASVNSVSDSSSDEELIMMLENIYIASRQRTKLKGSDIDSSPEK